MNSATSLYYSDQALGGHLQADGDIILAKPAVLADEERTAGRLVQEDVRVGGLGRVFLSGHAALLS